MIDYENIPAEIDRLHEEAEDLFDTARITPCKETSARLRLGATSRIRLAAALRAQVGG